MDEGKTATAIENVLNVMADVSVQNERINSWILSSAANVILNWPERIKTQPHDDRDNCFLPFDSKGPCGVTVNNDNNDDSATKHGDSHKSVVRDVGSIGNSSFNQSTFDMFVQGFREQHTLWDERTVRPVISHFKHREVVMCGTHMESGLLLQFFPFFFCQVLLPPFCVRRETRRIFCGGAHAHGDRCGRI